MIISLNWLKDYVSIEDIDPEKLAHILTMAGLEVETMYARYDYLQTVVVGHVRGVTAHPDADRLQIATVECGDRTLSVVCGAPNLSPGIKVPLALTGTRLLSGMEIKKTRVRGVESEGMLCSEAELGLGPDASGLMVLPADAPSGTPLSEALGIEDTIFDISITPNRPDCLSIIGIAREVAAALGTRVKYPEIKIFEGDGNIGDYTSVAINSPELCHRYSARLLTGVRVKPSPFWLADRLRAVGLKPINNIVDITNYVMMETGQPLHAFDFDKLAENRIIVKKAGKLDKFTTLDGKTRKIAEDTLMICDAQKPVAVAGVMGGENSEIGDQTTRVLIESAYFLPTSIRRTAKQLGISTDASYRFERGIDPNGCIRAMDRAAQLMAEIGNGKIIGGIIDEHPRPAPIRKIRIDVGRTNQYIGTDLAGKEMIGLLKAVEFKASAIDTGLIDVTVPSFRVDVSRPEDLAEEIARLWGYDRIAPTFPKISAAKTHEDRPLAQIRDRIRDTLCGFGFYEAISYSFIAENAYDKLNVPENDPRRDVIKILNPISEDLSVMRTTLIPGLLEAMRTNIAHQESDLKLFEIGKTFFNKPGQKLPEEREMAAGLITGNRFPPQWHTQPTPVDFFDAKGVCESLLSCIGIQGATFSTPDQSACAYTHPKRTALIHASGIQIGSLGEISTNVMKNFELRQTAFVFELFIDRLVQVPGREIRFRPIPKFPAVTRDITMIVSLDLPVGEILQKINSLKENLVEDFFLLDVYSGKPIPDGKKSVSLRIRYRSSEKTLKDRDINELHAKISKHIVSHFKAALPG